ncbi:MAG: class I SAM-dependent methyltransferase [Planctomycetales bacterium]|nr:class I SAM-dependent methyltransferase [Planctomycetales bacterium]MCA9264784.1 class I SAM-dependent methyltransferase [Planctomycetales bacterium]
MTFEYDETQRRARAYYDRMAREEQRFARPVNREELSRPLQVVDGLGWLGASIRGQKLLCLAAGGGRQSALYAAAGADVTVVDISPEMLRLDRQVATEHKLRIATIEASMDNLSMLANATFDIVVQPVSTCYVSDVERVYREVARVTRPGGLYISQHKQPTSLQVAMGVLSQGYVLSERYYRQGPLPPSGPCRHREAGSIEYLHRWEQLIGGMCRAGFVIEDFVEPPHARADADAGSFGHRSQFVAPYVRVKARRRES